MNRSPLTIALTVLAGVASAAPGRASAQEATVTAPAAPAAPAVTTSPAQLLGAADAAIEAGNLDAAAALYDQLAREHPGAPEANEARRALKIIAARRTQLPAPVAVSPGSPGDGTTGVVVRREPYSLRTSERLRLSSWEKIDFGVTSFLYGMSVGFSFSLSLDSSSSSNVLPPVALGAIAYTAAGVAYLQAGEPDRGDLPLVLAISFFMPTTTLLVANVASDNPNSQHVAAATAAVGLLSVPVAIVAAREFDPDPGDMQLVRDSIFWGLVLGTTSSLAWGGETIDAYGYSRYQGPSSRKMAAYGLIGMTGGLGLGTLAALNSEVSLERVRATTWGGYGGAVLGLLLGGAAADNEGGAWAGVTIGSVLGLAITFLATSGLDGIPPEDLALRAPRRPRFTPTLLPVTDAEGRARTALGITGVLF
jgi:hypothetical protein